MAPNLRRAIITIVILIIVAIGFLTSCKSKVVTVETTKVDTIKVHKIIEKTPAQLNELVIDNPCDSLGNLKPFQYNTSSGKVKTIIKTIDNTIYVQQNIDSLYQVWEKEYKSKFQSKYKEVEVPVIPKWAWWSLLGNVIVILYLIKKFTSWFNFLPF